MRTKHISAWVSLLAAAIAGLGAMDARAAQIDRGFYRIEEGQVHVRQIMPAAAADTARAARARADAPLPIVLLHQSPVSSRAMQPLMLALAARRSGARIVAPDTLGNGDSPPPAPAQPDIAYFAGALERLLDTMGIGRIDLYGSHTGARVATEFAATRPARVRRLVLDGIVDYPTALQQRILENYAPEMRPDEYGRHLIWAFNYTRDQDLYSPHFVREAANRLSISMASPEELHLRALDILKALGTYHKPYLAAFRYVARERIPLVKAPTLMITSPADSPALHTGAKQLAPLLPDGRHRELGVGVDAKAEAIAEFLR